MYFKKNYLSRLTMIAIATGMIAFAASCDKKDDPVTPEDGPVGNHPPVQLDCNYFEQDRVLTNDPEAPVDYVISCEADVMAALTVEPGVVIAFEENASLVITDEATLTMEGTAKLPIVLTGVEKEVGMWRGMLISSQKPSNSMKYVRIEYAGSKSTSHIGWPTAGLQVYANANVTIDHCTFTHNRGRGVFWAGDPDGPDGTITNSVMTNNDFPMMTGSGANTIKLFNKTNDYSGNKHDYVHIQYSGINTDLTWESINVPYYVETRLAHRFEVNNDAKLTIEPGTEIIFSSSTKFRIRDGSSLIMVGTEDNPIILRGMDDVTGSWNCVVITTNSALNEIGHVIFKNAGQTTGYPNGAIRLYSHAFLNIHDVTFSNCFEYGMSISYGPDYDFVLTYDNLVLDNTPKLFSDWSGAEVTNP